MLFTQIHFWVFFGAVIFVFSLAYRRIGLRNGLLFLASLYFYYAAGGLFVVLLFLLTLLNYLAGMILGTLNQKTKRKLLLLTGIFINLGLLSWLKYEGFFISVFNSVFKTHFEVYNIIALSINKISGSALSLTDLIIPVGISFYTFQSVSYLIEVYRRKVEPVRSFTDFGSYITFFPNLISGPIVKPAQFIPQFKNDYELSREDFGRAVFLILIGLIKKMVISDYISVNFVSRAYDNPQLFTGAEQLFAAYGYALQIYCDFSGYTDIAIGLALLMGFRLPPNFNAPYKATDISDFWKRWHMSLTIWFRDYLFLPLAYYLSGKMPGKTYLKVRTEKWIYLVSTLTTFLLCGLWHGSSMSFVIWGGIHGAALVLHKLFFSKIRFRAIPKKLVDYFSRFITFHFIVFTWIIFRSKDLDIAGLILKKIGTQFHPELVFQIITAYKPVFLIIMAGFILILLPEKIKTGICSYFIRSPEWIKVSVVIILIIFVYQFRTSGIQPFIYFQF